MARASGTSFVFESAKLPALDGALDLARAGVETGGAAHNRRYVLPALTLGADIAPGLVTLAHDPQTSGGLLAAIPRSSVKGTSPRPRKPPHSPLALRPGRGLTNARRHPSRDKLLLFVKPPG